MHTEQSSGLLVLDQQPSRSPIKSGTTLSQNKMYTAELRTYTQSPNYINTAGTGEPVAPVL